MELDEVCYDRAYDLWTCTVAHEIERITCKEGGPVRFTTSAGECTREAIEAEQACGTSFSLDLPPPPSLCAWQCALAAATDCVVDDCEAACQSRYVEHDGKPPSRSSQCAAAALLQWTCLAEARRWYDSADGHEVVNGTTGANPTTCGEDAIEFAVPEGTCRAEAIVVQAICGQENPLRIPFARVERSQDGGG